MSDLASGLATISSEEKRGPGRPSSAKQSLQEMQPIGERSAKKGKRSWKPAALLDVVDKEKGFRYRWVNKDKQNMFNKQNEGWETVSGITFDRSKQPDDVKRMIDGANMGTMLEKHDSILMRLPEEMGLERDAYYNNETARREAGITSHVKKEAGKQGTDIHGEITISSRHGTKTVE